jgi:hypothetical protein
LVDLFANLQATVEALKPDLASNEPTSEIQKSKKSKSATKTASAGMREFTEDSIHAYGRQIGLAQSAVLCMDIIGRGVKSAAKRPAIAEMWSPVLKNSLNSMVSIALSLLAKSLEEVHLTASEAIVARVNSLRADELKLLGSMLLLSSTVSNVLGAAALGSLNVSLRKFYIALSMILKLWYCAALHVMCAVCDRVSCG